MEPSEFAADYGKDWRRAARSPEKPPVSDRTYSEMIASLHDLPGTAFVLGDSRWSWTDLLRRATAAAGWLDDLGVRTATPVPALLTTNAPAIALALACAATTRPLAPLGPRLTERELGPCVKGLDAKVLIAEEEFADIAQRVAAATGVELVLLPDIAPATEFSLPTPAMSDVASILHTSGTTGLPKPVWMTQRTLAQRALVNSKLLGFDTTTVWVSASPFHHIAGWGNVAVALSAGATIVSFPRFSVDAWRGLADLGVSHAMLVPTMIDILLEEGILELPELRTLQYGSAPIHPDTLRRAMQVLPHVAFVCIFGQTEGSPITCLTPEDHLLATAGSSHLLESVGRPVPGVQLRIEAMSDDGIGEVLAQAPHLFRLEGDGWQHTGDLGRLDEDGYLYLVGRKGDKIIRGGENVYPLEVENVLTEHAGVVDAAVVGVPDRRLGEIVKAYIVPAVPGSAPTPEELRLVTRQRLAGFKVPALWEFVEALPHNANGKLIRAELVARATATPS